MKPHPVIPTPPAQRWKDFKLTGVPVLVFGICTFLAMSLWKSNFATSALVGEAEIVQASVTSPQAGSLTQVQVARLDPVAQDQILAYVVTTPPKVAENSLAVIKAEIAVIQSGMAEALDQQRNSMSWEQLQLDLMNHRIEFAAASISLRYAELELERATKLYQDKLVSDERLDLARSTREQAKSRRDGLASVIDALSPRLEQLGGESGQKMADAAARSVRAAIAVQEEKLRLAEAQMQPIPLLAPIAGHVTTVFKRTGENLEAGESIMTITSDRSERVTAYLRQPLSVQPHKGMPVILVTRGARREQIDAVVQQVGVSWEPIPASLLPRGLEADRGLAISVGLPGHLKVRPGELLEIRFQPSGDTAGN